MSSLSPKPEANTYKWITADVLPELKDNPVVFGAVALEEMIHMKVT